VTSFEGAMTGAKLVCMVPSALGTVWFDFHPDAITISRQAQTSYRPSASANGGRPGGASASIFQARPARPSRSATPCSPA